MKKRFPCLKLLRVQPLFAAKIIMACATLHNLASQEDFEFEPPNIIPGPNGINNAPNIVPNARQQEILNYFA
jgi:hypothetical protein